MPHHVLHGYVVASDVPLDEPAIDGNGDAQIRVHRHTTELPTRPPDPGAIVADLTQRGRDIYVAVDSPDGTVVSFPELAQFLIEPDLETIHCHAPPEADEQLLALLIKGTVMSIVLGLKGLTVLHASGVERGGQAILFAGLTGMGKSTCAALACASGARLVADDAVVLERGETLMVRRGGTHLRLRPQAVSIVDQFEAPPTTWPTVDGRIAVAPTLSGDRLPLAAVVIPRPSADHPDLVVARRRPSAALPMLSAFLRVPGWRRPAIRRTHFLDLAAMLDRVSVFDAFIPWGPPFRVEPISRLLATVVGQE